MAAESQHWVVTCTTCGDPAEHHCNTCGDILCSRCKGMHQRSNATSHHEVVPYSERVATGKLAGQCLDHPGNPHVYWCKTCNKAICSECVTSTAHQGHQFTKLSSQIEEKRKNAKNEFDKYSKLLIKWEHSLHEIQTQRKDYATHIIEQEKEISKQADEICSKVRHLESEKRKELQKIKTYHTKHLQDQEKSIINGLTEIKQHIKEVEDKLRSDDPGLLLNCSVRDDESIAPFRAEPLQLPIFTPGTLDNESLTSMLGNITTEGKAASGENKDTESPLAKPLEISGENDSDPNQPSEDGTTSLFPKVSHILTLTTEFLTNPYLACTESGQAWIRNADRNLQLTDREGNVKKTINLNFNTACMSVAPRGDLIVTDQSNKCIKSISINGNITKLFDTKWNPFGICCLLNGDMMVTFHTEGRVVQYSRTGKIVKELEKSLFNSPGSVTQNKINQHIYVSDFLAVQSFDMNDRLQYKYTGSDDSRFNPAGVCTDQAGHVIITDQRNHRVHLLDKDGRFLQYLLTEDQGLQYPHTIDTDNEGYVWVSEKYFIGNQVKIFRYM